MEPKKTQPEKIDQGIDNAAELMADATPVDVAPYPESLYLQFDEYQCLQTIRAATILSVETVRRRLPNRKFEKATQLWLHYGQGQKSSIIVNKQWSNKMKPNPGELFVVVPNKEVGEDRLAITMSRVAFDLLFEQLPIEEADLDDKPTAAGNEE